MVGKLKDVVSVPIATTHVGAFARPSWYDYTFKGADIHHMLSHTRWREAYMDATKVVMQEQETAGLDIFTDGGIRYDGYYGGWGWPAFVTERLGGVKPGGKVPYTLAPTPILAEMLTSAMPGVVVDQLHRGNLQFAEFYRASQQFTQRPVKFSVIDPTLVTMMVNNEYYKDPAELTMDLAKVYNQEFRDLAAAGCRIIQTDDFAVGVFSGFAPIPKDQWNLAVEAFNTAVAGVHAQIWMHFCWGRPANQFAFGRPGSYEELFKNIGDAKADVIQIEAASTMGDNLEHDLRWWKEYCPDKDVGIGVVNHRRTEVETPEQVVGVVTKALKFVEPDHLCLSGDCGTAALPRNAAYYKLKSTADGARMVRKELGLAE